MYCDSYLRGLYRMRSPAFCMYSNGLYRIGSARENDFNCILKLAVNIDVCC